MPQTVTINRIIESVGRGEGNRIIPMLRVEFMVDKHGPFSQEFPRESFDPRAARAKLEAFARDLDVLALGH